LAVPIGKVAGIPIYLDYSWFVIFFLLVWTIGFSLMPATYPGLGQLDYLFIGVVSALLLFVSIVVHELAHSIVAKRSGMRIRRITLYLLGGVSEMEEEPKNASLELRMAAAGPLTSLAISLFLGVVWLLSVYLHLSALVQAPLFYISLVNALVAGFNLIPAFPMDGGRVLRSLLWRRNGDVVRSTVTASNAGRIIAYVLIFFGLFSIFFVDIISGLWFVLIGWFISSSASASLRQTMLEEDLRGTKAADLMTRQVDSVPPEMTLDVLSEEFLRAKHTGFPVLSNGELEGCVTMDDLRRVKREMRSTTRVQEVMTPKDKLVTVSPDVPATDITTSMQQKNIGRVFVMDGGKITGVITRSDVLKAVELKEGVLGITRGRRRLEGQVSLTAETGMNFVLEQPAEKDFSWRAEFSGEDVQLVNQESARTQAGREVQRFMFQSSKAGTHVIRLLEVQGPPGTSAGAGGRATRTVTYTVTVSPPHKERI
jgi:Zn-dependent protease/CBS domain-containing protein